MCGSVMRRFNCRARDRDPGTSDAAARARHPKPVLEEKLYGIDDELESNAIPVHVHHLRRRLVEAGASAEIHTVRGVGYLLTEAKP